jgi:hypothetical protein
VKLLWNLTKLAAIAATWLVTLLCWVWHFLSVLTTWSSDWRAARRTYRDGTLYCPNSHAIAPSAVFLCPCGWVYRDDAYGLVCKNPECDRPYTNIVQCTVCGESVRNPLRFGRR